MQDINEIYKRYSKTVYHYILCLSSDADLSEEIVQETFLVAVKNIHQFKGNCKITTWLCQIAKYIWYRKLKKKKAICELPLEELENKILFDDCLEEKICQKENKMNLLKNIQQLDENTKTVMYLRILGNLDYQEIGEIMNRSPNWARVTFFRGKEKLKEEMKDETGM